VGLRSLLAGLLATLALAAPAAAGPAQDGARWLAERQRPDGGFAEVGRPANAPLTAWAALALVAGGAPGDARARALDFLRAHADALPADTDVALHVLARIALGERPSALEALLARLRAHRPGALVNATTWTVLALRAAGEEAPPSFVRAIRSAQARDGGWPWSRGGQPDSNDTAAALQALVAAGVRGRPIERGLAALRRFQKPDGGFGLTRSRASDAQSTAWAIQALLAGGQSPGKPAFRFLARMRRADGSYRYSAAYATTPVWVTAQVVPALAGRPFPLAG
jgi:hypothetical protein